MKSAAAGPVAQQRALTRLGREKREHYRRLYADVPADVPTHRRRSTALAKLSREYPDLYRTLFREERTKLGPNDERREIDPDVIGKASGPGPAHAVLADGSTTACGRIRFSVHRTAPGTAAQRVTCTHCVDEITTRPKHEVDPQFGEHATTAETRIRELSDLRARTAAAEAAAFEALAVLRLPPTGTPERERLSALLGDALASGLTLAAIGSKMRVTGERIRQLIADPSGKARSAAAGADHHGQGTIPPEAWDHAHPDHDWWVDGAGQCFDKACPRHPADHHGQGDGRNAP